MRDQLFYVTRTRKSAERSSDGEMRWLALHPSIYHIDVENNVTSMTTLEGRRLLSYKRYHYCTKITLSSYLILLCWRWLLQSRVKISLSTSLPWEYWNMRGDTTCPPPVNLSWIYSTSWDKCNKSVPCNYIIPWI